MTGFLNKLKANSYLFKILVQRDFNRKYKRTVLGILWSLVMPLFQLTVMALVFTHLFGKSTEHFVIYLFSGNLVFNFFRDGTSGGMSSLVDNSSIFTKVNVPKYLFILSKNASALINFLLTLCIFWIFVALEEGVYFSAEYFSLIFPIACLLLFNIGISFILSAFYVVFKDIKYLYDVFTQLLSYFSAIFYTVDRFPENAQPFFFLNPVYVFIYYFRSVVLNNTIPDIYVHGLCLFYSLSVLLIGFAVYRKNNNSFLYYL